MPVHVIVKLAVLGYDPGLWGDLQHFRGLAINWRCLGTTKLLASLCSLLILGAALASTRYASMALLLMTLRALGVALNEHCSLGVLAILVGIQE